MVRRPTFLGAERTKSKFEYVIAVFKLMERQCIRQGCKSQAAKGYNTCGPTCLFKLQDVGACVNCGRGSRVGICSSECGNAEIMRLVVLHKKQKQSLIDSVEVLKSKVGGFRRDLIAEQDYSEQCYKAYRGAKTDVRLLERENRLLRERLDLYEGEHKLQYTSTPTRRGANAREADGGNLRKRNTEYESKRYESRRSGDERPVRLERECKRVNTGTQDGGDANAGIIGTGYANVEYTGDLIGDALKYARLMHDK
jgi:hypothetical protein